MSQLLALYKYRGSEGLGPVMAALLASAYERIRDELPQRTKAPLFHAVTSVPLAPERLEERGFNQAERMAQTLAGWYALPCLPLLQRVRHTEKQSLKTRRNRLADMKGNFSAADARLPATLFPPEKGPVRILLIDDIYTTGSTVNECAGALKRMISSGTERLDIEIYGALWARS